MRYAYVHVSAPARAVRIAGRLMRGENPGALIERFREATGWEPAESYRLGFRLRRPYHTDAALTGTKHARKALRSGSGARARLSDDGRTLTD